MQHSLNHISVEKAVGEALSGPHARRYLIGALALALLATAGLGPACVWSALALFVEFSPRVLRTRAIEFSPAQSQQFRFIVEFVQNSAWACAPAICWHVDPVFGAATAAAMLCLLLSYTAFTPRLLGGATLLVCAPYLVVALTFLADAATPAALFAFGACALLCAYAFAIAQNAAQRARHARTQDNEWVRQLNMNLVDPTAVAWEIDFEQRCLSGADSLAQLAGRAVSFADVIEGGLFAPSHERDLVRANFAPGAPRQIIVEHDLEREDGALLRVRHHGFLRTTPGGAPDRFTCITRRAADDEAGQLQQALDQAEKVLAAQTTTLALIANELSARHEHIPALGVEPVRDTRCATRLAAALAALDARREAIAGGVVALVDARNTAENASVAKSQFLANMSHELRTPLNAIIGYAEMLQEDAGDRGDDSAVQDLARVLSSARHLLDLIGEVLDLSKIEAGRMDVSAAPFALNDLIGELMDTMRPLAETNGSQLAFANADGELILNTDATKLRQCVLNLLSNACKFTENGRIDVSCTTDGADVLIAVADTGIGMTPDFMAHLFTPYTQAKGNAHHARGTGLGLTITRKLAQLLGGDVHARSEAGAGAVFTLRIPTHYARFAAADEIRGEGPLVVVIEDDADARELAARALARAGFSVLGVSGGEPGLAAVRARQPALVLLDIFLPDRSGWRVLQSLKQDERTREVPVVVLSINDDRAQALALGAAAHLVKPVERDQLAATAMRLARLQPTTAQSQANAPEKLARRVRS